MFIRNTYETVQYQRPYYYNAFNSLVLNFWKGTEYEYNHYEIRNLCYYKALTSFYYAMPEDLINRRELLYHYLVNEFKASEQGTLQRFRTTLPINENINRILFNYCTAYNETPSREFSDNEEIYESLYNEINSQLKDAYSIGKLCGLVAVRPYFIDGKFKLKIIAPDNFRVKLSETNNFEPEEIIYIDYDINGNIIHQTWNKDFYFTTDLNGSLIGTMNPNPYNEIPFVFLRLENSNGFWTSGMYNLVENRLRLNKLLFLADLNASFNSSPVKIGINIPDSQMDLMPDKIISATNVTQGDGMLLPPSLEFINPIPQYDSIYNYAKEIEKDNYIALGFPNSMFDAQSGTISGISRVIERQELIEMRQADINYLIEFEKRLLTKIALIATTDGAYNLPLTTTLNIDFGDERIYLEPDIEYEFDKKKMQDGVIAPMKFFQKWGGIDTTMTEQEAVKLIQERKALLKEFDFTAAPAVIPATDKQVMTEIQNTEKAQTNPLQNDLNNKQIDNNLINKP